MLNSSCSLDFRRPADYQDIFLFERQFNYLVVHKWTTDLFPAVGVLTAVYVAAIHAGQRFMRRRPALELRPALFAWNATLALYSLVAFVRVSGETGRLLRQHGFRYSICELHSVEHKNMMGFWLLTFAVSKVLELGDTAFIVLRKTPLIFLHWYHHVATLLFVWYSSVHITPLGRWFIVANLFVHAIMYSYYALKTLRLKLPRLVSMTITSLQLVQMVVGVVITVAAYWIKRDGAYCCVDNETIFLAWAMYLSYFLLFANFFIKSYCCQRTAPVADAERKKAE